MAQRSPRVAVTLTPQLQAHIRTVQRHQVLNDLDLLSPAEIIREAAIHGMRDPGSMDTSRQVSMDPGHQESMAVGHHMTIDPRDFRHGDLDHLILSSTTQERLATMPPWLTPERCIVTLLDMLELKPDSLAAFEKRVRFKHPDWFPKEE